jgi:hypothetical protein
VSGGGDDEKTTVGVLETTTFLFGHVFYVATHHTLPIPNFARDPQTKVTACTPDQLLSRAVDNKRAKTQGNLRVLYGHA